MSVMAVMSVTFPYTYRVFYMTVNWWCVLGASYHRHALRHRENGLDKGLSQHHDGDDAHDGHLRGFSRWGSRLYFVGSLIPSTNPTNPTPEPENPIPMQYLKP